LGREEKYVMREAALAAVLVVLAVLTLGTDWTGVEVAPGVWRDRVTLTHWSFFYGAVALVGVATGRWVLTWPRRLIVLGPVLAWITWQLRLGTLWPIALSLYGTGTVLSWLMGCAASVALAGRRRA
jgi:hypothetical protein